MALIRTTTERLAVLHGKLLSRLQVFDQWSKLALARFVLAAIVALGHLAEYTELGALSFVPKFGAFEAILGFLLISGYSVTTSYIAKKEGFLVRRLSRLYPIYIGSIALTLAVNFYLQNKSLPNSLELALNALFLNQMFTQTSIVGPAWSLSLEFWLYCLLPILLSFGLKTNRALAYGSFAAYLIYTALRTLLHQPYYSGLGYGLNIIFLAFAWICGSALARQAMLPATALRDIALLLSTHLGAAVLIQLGYRLKRDTLDQFFSTDFINYLLQAFTLFFVYTLLKNITLRPQTNKRKSKVMGILGDISYPLYLIHIPVYIAASTAGIRSPYANFAIALAVAWLMYLCFDFYSKRRGHLDKP